MSKIRILLLILGLLAVTGAPTLGHAKTMRPEEGTSESEKMPEKGETPPATPAQPEAEGLPGLRGRRIGEPARRARHHGA